MDVNLEIQQLLEPLAKRQRRLVLLCQLATCWVVAALFAGALAMLERQMGWGSRISWSLIGLAAIAAAAILWVRHSKHKPDWRRLALQIEAHQPELKGRLITSVQQRPDAKGELNYLQRRLVSETLERARQGDWTGALPPSRLI